MWGNNIKGLLNKQCKAISFYITLICKLVVAFLGHYSGGKNYTKQIILNNLHCRCRRLQFCCFFLNIRNHSTFAGI